MRSRQDKKFRKLVSLVLTDWHISFVHSTSRKIIKNKKYVLERYLPFLVKKKKIYMSYDISDITPTTVYIAKYIPPVERITFNIDLDYKELGKLGCK